jgi:hypothetical protein
MAIIQRGSINNFSAGFARSVHDISPGLSELLTFSDIREARRSAQPEPIVFNVSADPRGLALKSLKLTKGFEGFLQNIINPTNEVYFLAWCWDFNGFPAVFYPGAEAMKESCIIPLRVGDIREFIHSGIVLFPARIVTAGLAVRIMLWECDAGRRNFGRAMIDVADTIRTSKLNNLISMISSGINVTAATIALIKDASIELAGVVGKILQANSDDYVDFYEGYYPAAEAWTTGEETYKGNASEITLTRL